MNKIIVTKQEGERIISVDAFNWKDEKFSLTIGSRVTAEIPYRDDFANVHADCPCEVVGFEKDWLGIVEIQLKILSIPEDEQKEAFEQIEIGSTYSIEPYYLCAE